jgi:hypothetical protein
MCRLGRIQTYLTQSRKDRVSVVNHAIAYRTEVLDAHDIAELVERSALGRAGAGCEERDLFRGWFGHGHG